MTKKKKQTIGEKVDKAMLRFRRAEGGIAPERTYDPFSRYTDSIDSFIGHNSFSRQARIGEFNYERIRSPNQNSVDIERNPVNGTLDIRFDMREPMRYGIAVREEEIFDAYGNDDAMRNLCERLAGQIASEVERSVRGSTARELFRSLQTPAYGLGFRPRVDYATTTTSTNGEGGRRIDYEAIRHAMDMMGGPQRSREKPEKAERFEHTKDLPKVVEHDGFKAVILDDTVKLWNESNLMKHCIYRSYSNIISRGEYVAYHVHAPKGVSKKGRTVGFVKRSGKWELEQCKGPNNSQNNNDKFENINDKLKEALENV